MPDEATMTAQEFAQKVNWEGGVLDALMYGLRGTEINEDGSDEARELAQEWRRMRQAWSSFNRQIARVEKALDAVERRHDSVPG